MGVTVRVETNGASGVGNRLTAEEIAKAEGVIIAADKAVETARFDGKKLISKPVAAGIRQTEELIQTNTWMEKQMSSTLKMLHKLALAKKS